MAFVTRIAGAAALGTSMLAGAGVFAPSAQAAYIVTLAQEGRNVVATGSGSIDLTDLTFFFSGNTPSAGMTPIFGLIQTGPASFTQVANYIGFTGPRRFGRGDVVFASSGSGDSVGIFRANGTLAVPLGYISGHPLSDTSTYDNATLASLGVVPGAYVWTWGSGAHADSFTLDIKTASVSEPSGLLLLMLPLGLVVLLAGRHATRGEEGGRKRRHV